MEKDKPMNINRLKQHVYILLLINLIFMPPLMAEIYSWTDEQGRKYFSSTPPKHIKSNPITLKINSFKGVSVKPSAIDTGNKVIMYSTSWCGYCKKAKRYFNKKNIQFTEYDIEKNARAKRQYKRLNGKGVPLILVGKKRMNGFSERGFKRIFN